MRKWYCVPMIALYLLLTGCGAGEEKQEEKTAQAVYKAMSGCVMEAEVTSGVEQEDAGAFTLRCEYLPEGACTVEILSPETVAGIQAVVDGGDLSVVYEDLCLPLGTLSREKISPAACLPWLMDALRDGWLLEESTEVLDGIPYLRLCLDETDDGAAIEATVWLRKEDWTPLRGEISVDGKIILTAEFTKFRFYDTINSNVSKRSGDKSA